ncbi:MAG: peptidoglycan DD-metalloendopeptidase family protein, partial [Bradymonadaceae bacterium]
MSSNMTCPSWKSSCFFLITMVAILLWGCGDGTLDGSGGAGSSGENASVGEEVDDEPDVGIPHSFDVDEGVRVGLDVETGTDVEPGVDVELGPDVGSGTDAYADADAEEEEEEEPEPPAPSFAGPFVWPMTAWVSATDVYASGNAHGGTADLAAPFYAPVRPARDGRVTRRGWSNVSGWFVQLEHPAADGYLYTTFYGHLAEDPVVRVGDEVSAFEGGGTILGYNSRTGHARSPHVHFTLRMFPPSGDSVRVVVPGLEIGDWVESGQTIAGNFPGLEPVEVLSEPRRPHEVVVNESGGLRAYGSTARRGAEVVADLTPGTRLDVLSTSRGQYEVVLPGGSRGWVPMSGVREAKKELFGIVTDIEINVRDAPRGEIIGRILEGTLLTGFDVVDEPSTWYRVLWDCRPERSLRNTNADN